MTQLTEKICNACN